MLLYEIAYINYLPYYLLTQMEVSNQENQLISRWSIVSEQFLVETSIYFGRWSQILQDDFHILPKILIRRSKVWLFTIFTSIYYLNAMLNVFITIFAKVINILFLESLYEHKQLPYTEFQRLHPHHQKVQILQKKFNGNGRIFHNLCIPLHDKFKWPL